jgi:DNA-binding NarL/FixJ family response regulator
MNKLRVVIADDQDIIRQGLQTILDHQADMSVVGHARNGGEAVECARTLQPDVVLMDIRMPVMDGIEATRQICAQFEKVHVLILTTYDHDNYVFEGIRAGAQGYLLKDAETETLLDAIRGVTRGESQLDPAIARKVMDEFRRAAPLPVPAPDANYEALTERELEVLRLIAQGQNNKTIAQTLFLSEGRVRNIVSEILGKLQANDRTEALVKAARKGYVKL